MRQKAELTLNFNVLSHVLCVFTGSLNNYHLSRTRAEGLSGKNLCRRLRNGVECEVDIVMRMFLDFVHYSRVSVLISVK